MAAHAHIGIPRSREFLARLKAFTSRFELDHRLAASAGPLFDPRTSTLLGDVAFRAAFLAEAD